eukprot:365662-Chlamydomonas_euryale.AAC.4
MAGQFSNTITAVSYSPLQLPCWSLYPPALRGCANAFLLDFEVRSIFRSYVAMPYFRTLRGVVLGLWGLAWSDFGKKGTVGKLFTR